MASPHVPPTSHKQLNVVAGYNWLITTMSWRWMHPDYETSLAIIFTFISALIPWSFAIQQVQILDITTYHMRWWAGELQYASADMKGFVFLHDLHAAQAVEPFIAIHTLWAITSTVFIVAFVFALLLIPCREQVEAKVPVHLVSGGLLVGSATGYLLTNLWMMISGIPGTYAPIGGLVMFAFGAFLLTNKVESKQDIYNRLSQINDRF